MNLTLFDLIDGGMLAAVLYTFARLRAWRAQWAVLSLILFHVAGRGVLFHDPHAFFWLASGASMIAAGFLIAPVLTNWGRVAGCLWALVSMVALVQQQAGAALLQGGLRLDSLNLISACLDLIALILIFAMVRRDAILARTGLDA